MRYRSRSPVRFMAEVDDLSSTYKIFEFVAVDNIIDMRYSDAVLPQRAIVPRDQGKPEVAAGQGAVLRQRHQDPTTCREPEQQPAPAHAQGRHGLPEYWATSLPCRILGRAALEHPHDLSVCPGTYRVFRVG